ncbi:hypothetical protein MNEG_15618, partial [Monoraphidium neglectum]
HDRPVDQRRHRPVRLPVGPARLLFQLCRGCPVPAGHVLGHDAPQGDSDQLHRVRDGDQHQHHRRDERRAVLLRGAGVLLGGRRERAAVRLKFFHRDGAAEDGPHDLRHMV